MNAILPKKTIKFESGATMNPGEVYLVSHSTVQNVEKFQQTHGKGSIEVTELKNIIKEVNINDDFRTLIMFRTGGIGDLLALSSICNFFQDKNIFFATQPKYYEVFSWFKKQPIALNINGCFLNDFTFKTRLTKYRNWRSFIGEGIIENNNGIDWYEVFYSYIGSEFIPDSAARPQLIKHRLNDKPSNLSDYNSDYRKIIIANRATSMMRTFHFSDIYEVLKSHLKGNDLVFVYQNNLSIKDKVYIKDNDLSNVISIQSNSLTDYLLDLYDADFVVSTDSAAIHFREGIEKPAIGLYNSFTKDSRTKHYKFTQSFDIASDCDKQPCFLHEKPNLRHCEKSNNHDFAPPCFDIRNKFLKPQLNEIFRQSFAGLR